MTLENLLYYAYENRIILAVETDDLLDDEKIICDAEDFMDKSDFQNSDIYEEYKFYEVSGFDIVVDDNHPVLKIWIEA